MKKTIFSLCLILLSFTLIAQDSKQSQEPLASGYNNITLGMTLDQAKEIRKALNDDIKTVGVFVNADENVLTNGEIDPVKLSPITYDPINHTYLKLGDVVAKAFDVGNSLK